MTAEELGRRLLSEVEETNLQELLKLLQILAANTPSSSLSTTITPHLYVNVPLLDRLISLKNPPVHSTTSPQTNVQHPPVIELTSAAPGTGKTQLLYYLTAASILPRELGGKIAAVVWMDTDGGFDVVRLAQVVRGFIITHRASPTTETSAVMDQDGESSRTGTTGVEMGEADLETTVHRALQHVHVFRPTSLASLIATIQQLPTYLLDSTAHVSSARELSLLLIDPLTAFFWQHRMASDAPPSSTPTPIASYASLVSALRAVQSLFSPTIITTSWGLLPVSSTNSRSFRALLPQPWPAFPTLRLTIAREAVNRFPVGMGVAEAVRDREVRQRVVEKGRVGVWADGRWVCAVEVGGKGVVVDGGG